MVTKSLTVKGWETRMPCTPELRSLPMEEVRVQAGKGGTGEAGGSRVVSSSSNIITRSKTVAVGVDLHRRA